MSASATRLVVVSPHLDDAVFGAGRLLAAHRGSTVVTVFAGVPEPGLRTDWDRLCGFADGREAVLARREEDREALRPLSAHPLWLDFLDAQYAPAPERGALVEALRGVLASTPSDTVLAPCGLFHSDHVRVHEACLALRPEFADRDWLLYEDALYRRKPGLLQQRLAALAARGLRTTPVAVPLGPPSLKEGAVQSYASQLKAFGPGGCDDLGTAERYWRLDLMPERGDGA